jgi:hypothetical protein
MTGPDHYNRAEVLLEEWEHNRDKIGDLPRQGAVLAAAQAHATLALAAAAGISSGRVSP